MFTLWKLIALTHNASHIDANSHHGYRPALQAMFSVVYTSVTRSVSTTTSPTWSSSWPSLTVLLGQSVLTLSRQGNNAAVLAPSHWRY